MTAVIETTGLGKRYRRLWALADCTLSIPAGHVVGLVGPNGAGKTTLLSLAAGLIAPSPTSLPAATGPSSGPKPPSMSSSPWPWPGTASGGSTAAASRDRPAPKTLLRPSSLIIFRRWLAGPGPSWDRPSVSFGYEAAVRRVSPACCASAASTVPSSR